MMHQVIDAGAAFKKRARDQARAAGWCIVRTSGGRTLAVAEWLVEAGFEAWTPKRTSKRDKPGRCNLIDGRKPTVEIDLPILPTFVFARARQVDAIAALECDDNPLRPAFSLLRHRGRAPLVADREVEGLKEEERAELALLEELRAVESRQEKLRIRAKAAKTERARKAALRAERRHFDRGAEVSVNLPAFAGMTGVIESSDGKSAMVLFGGRLMMKVEAWQISLDGVQAAQS